MAIRAQGTTLQIATGTGGAETITGATAAFPVVITAASHGFVAGDRVTIASVVGMTQLNGNTYTVEYATTNTFALKGIDGTGFTAYDSAGTATPVTFTTVAGAKSLDSGAGSASEVDTTTLSSTAKEFESGLVDYGEAKGEMNVSFTDAGQTALRARMADGAITNFKINYTDAGTTTESFTGFVKEIGQKLAVDGVLTASFSIRKTGATTWA